MRIFLVATLASLSAAAFAQHRGNDERVVEVRLSSFDFAPSTIRLRGGEPVVLRLVNSGRGGHNFSAPEFFAAATITDGARIRDGAVEVPSRQIYLVRLVPRRGRYRLRCTHSFHTAFGMRGEILVE